jgi:hypothetical protein
MGDAFQLQLKKIIYFLKISTAVHCTGYQNMEQVAARIQNNIESRQAELALISVS